MTILIDRNAQKASFTPAAVSDITPHAMSTQPFNAERGSTPYRLASSPQDREAASRLVYQRYREIGLIERNRFERRVTVFHSLPTTTVFVGCTAGTVLGTVTLITDSLRGLPLDSVFKKEMQQQRDNGLRMGEVSCLAFRPCKSKSQFRRRFFELNRVMAQFARHHAIDALVIAINPRHVRYYRQLMGFEQFGSVDLFPSVRNHPAAACLMEFAAVDRNPPPAYNAIFNKQIPASELCRYQMTVEERESLAVIACASGGDSTPLAVA